MFEVCAEEKGGVADLKDLQEKWKKKIKRRGFNEDSGNMRVKVKTCKEGTDE